MFISLSLPGCCDAQKQAWPEIQLMIMADAILVLHLLCLGQKEHTRIPLWIGHRFTYFKYTYVWFCVILLYI